MSISAKSSQGNVIIVGGGLGGMALALFLHKAGIKSTIYEAYTYKQGVGAGLGLAPNGMNVLAALGLAEKVKARGMLALENRFYNEHGRLLARIPNGSVEAYGQPAVSIMRPALYDILTEAIRERGIPLLFEKRLKTLTQTAKGVIAQFEDGSQAEGDLLIGADGIHSQTRRLILPDGPRPEYVGIISVSGVTPASAVPSLTLEDKQSFNFVYGANGFFGYSGVEHGDIMWWSNLRQSQMTREELTDLSLDRIKKQMLAIYGGFHEPIPTLIRQMTQPLKLNVYDIQSLPTWHKGRVLLIGDAAHAVSPNSGQGASMAFEDAMLLAKLLRDCADYAQVFAQFEHERKPRVEKIVAEGRRRGNDKEAVSPFKARMRDLMMSIFINLFGIKGVDWVYRYRIAWNN